MDIRLKIDDCNFFCRAAGLIEKDGKYLIMKIDDSKYYHIPGGHIEAFEDSKRAVCREIKEEVGIEVEPKNLFCINENFFIQNNKKFHGIEFYYVLKPKDNIPINDWDITENDKGNIHELHFQWASIELIKNIDLRPYNVKDLIINNQFSTFNHLIKRDI